MKKRLRRIAVMVGKDLKKLIREKSFGLVILSQLIVISLSITAFNTFPAVFYGENVPSALVSVAIVGNNAFYDFMATSLNLDVYRYDSLETALIHFKNGWHNAIIFCKDYYPSGRKPIVIDIYAKEDIPSSLLISRIKRILEDKEKKIRNDRIKEYPLEIKLLRIPDIPSTEIPSSIIYSLLLPLFFLSTVAISGNLFINIFTMEVENKTIDIILSTPVSRLDFLYSKSISCIILIPLQLSLWIMALSAGGFTLQNAPLLILLSILYGMVFTSLGIFSVYIAKNRDNAQNILTIFLVIVFIFLLPLPDSFIKNLGFLVNIIPAYLITKLACSGLGTCTITGFLITAVASILIFWVSHRFGSNYLLG